MKKKISIHDIARTLAVAPSTVSYIINGRAKQHRISSKLEKKVLDYITSIQYVPSHTAKSLRTGKSNLIGLIVDDISNNFFADLARYIEKKTFPLGYRLLYCSSENKIEKFEELIKLMQERHVDAYIITPPSGTQQAVKHLLNQKEKLVLFDRYFTNVPTSFVVIDNEKSTFDALEYLIEKNRQHIGFVSLASDLTVMKERKAGYTKAMKKRKLEQHILEVPFNTQSGTYVDQIILFLQENPLLDALFFSTSILGIAGLQALNKLHKKIPGEVAVISFDDNILFQLYSPTISVVAQPIESLADELIKIILQKQITNSSKIVLPATLIVRQST